MAKKEILVLLIILVIASFLRFYKIDAIPNGLLTEESTNGTTAQNVLATGDYKFYYPENGGHEGLFVALQSFSIKIFGSNAFALRFFPAIIGILTILGLFLLVRELFNWQIAATSGFLMSISFWHLNFSRLGLSAIFVPFFLVFALYFMWHGLKRNSYASFVISGIFGGLGFYSNSSFWFAPVIAILVFWNYWAYLKADFFYSKYEYARNKMLKGFTVLSLVTIIVALPIWIYFWIHPADLFNEMGSTASSISQQYSLNSLVESKIRTLGMINFSGDSNPTHNVPGTPMFSWPLGILFVIGFIKELIHWLKRKHGHFPVTHTLLIGWFVFMLCPGFFSVGAPDALVTLGVLPVLVIFAARGMWWIFESLNKWESAFKPSQISKHGLHIAPLLTIIILLASIGFVEGWKYFINFANNAQIEKQLNMNLISAGNYLNQQNSKIKKYVVFNRDNTTEDGLPASSATVKFISESYNTAEAESKNIRYLSSDKLSSVRFPAHFVLIPINKNTIINNIIVNNNLTSKNYENIQVYIK